MRALLLALLLSSPAFAQAPPAPPIGAFCLPTQATTHTMVNPTTGNTVVMFWCDLTTGVYHYAVAGSSTNWQQAQCLSTIEPFTATTVWLQHAWSACVTSQLSASDQAIADKLFAMWVPRATILGTQAVWGLNADGSLGAQVQVNGVPQTIATMVVGGLRFASGTASPRYCSVRGYVSQQGFAFPANSYALCQLVYAPLAGFSIITASPDGTSIQAPTTATLIDSQGHVWGIDSNGHVAVDGVSDTNTQNVFLMAYVGGLIWQENSGLWYSKTSPTAPWLPVGGTATAPI